MDAAAHLVSYTWPYLIEILSDKSLPYKSVGSFSSNKTPATFKIASHHLYSSDSYLPRSGTHASRQELKHGLPSPGWAHRCSRLSCNVTSRLSNTAHFSLQHMHGKISKLRKTKYSPSAVAGDEKCHDRLFKALIQSPHLKRRNVLTWYSLLDKLFLHLRHVVTLLTHPFSKWSASFFLITMCPQPVWQGIKAYSHKLWCSWK